MKRLIAVAVPLLFAACTTAPQTTVTPSSEPTTPVAVAPAPDPEAFRAQAPAPAAARPYRFPDVTRITLDNGMRVLVAENHNAPLVSIRVLVRSGADHDPADHSGLAAMTADLLDEGAGGRTALQIAEDVGGLGGTLQTGAGWDSSFASIDLLSRNAERGLGIIADVVMRPAFAAAEVDRVRKERLTTLLQQRDQAATIASNRFEQFVYGGTPYGRTILGVEATLRRITRSDVTSFHKRHYLPNNVSLIITGDITPAAAREMAQRAFASWKRGADVAAVRVAPQAMESSRIFLVDRPQAVQSEIRIGHVGVARSTPDYFPLLTMNSLLGGVFGSRINLNLRERHGYTYGARSSFAYRREAGPFVVSTPVRNEVTGASVREILSELQRIRSGDVTDDELRDAKNYLMGVFPNTVQTASDLASRLTEMELYGLPENYFDTYRERIAGVTREDIAHVANKYVHPDRVAIVVVGRVSDVQPQLSELQIPVATYDIEGRQIAR